MDALRAIGTPDYIQLLVNRGKNLLFIQACDKKEPQCFAVPSRVYTDTTFKYRLSKAAFAEAIEFYQSWDKEGKYRLYGTPVSDRVMRFSFDEAVRLDDNDITDE